MKETKIGCCGFPVAKSRYFQTFSVVEIQQTFYRLPTLKTALRWRQEAREGFEFCMKASQLITHEPSSPTYRRYKAPMPEEKRSRYGSFKPTEEVFRAWEDTREIAKSLEVQFIVFQCPPRFVPSEQNQENLRTFFKSIDRGDFTLVWESRGNWNPADIKRLCESLGLVHGVDPFKHEPLYGEIRYFRLHGRTGCRYRFSDEDLRWLAGLCKRRSVYCLFNNISMFDDARRFEAIVAG